MNEGKMGNCDQISFSQEQLQLTEKTIAELVQKYARF